MPVILMYNLLSSFSSSELNIPRLLENPSTRLVVLGPSMFLILKLLI